MGPEVLEMESILTRDRTSERGERERARGGHEREKESERERERGRETGSEPEKRK